MTAHKTITRLSVACVAAAIGTAPATAAPPTQVRASGKTLASSQLATDVLNRIAAYTRTNAGCNTLDAVDMQVMPPSYVPRQPPTAAAASRAGHFELWTVGACGRSRQFEVRLSPSPGGGSDFAVMPLAARVETGAPNSPASPASLTVSARPTNSRAAPSGPLVAWHGRYVWEESLGRIGGSSPAEGAAAFVTHTLSLGPSAGATGCTLNAQGFQTNTRVLCTATPVGTSVDIKFYRAAPGNVGGRHAIGDRLFTLTRDGGGIGTRLEALDPASDSTPRTGRLFKKVG